MNFPQGCVLLGQHTERDGSLERTKLYFQGPPPSNGTFVNPVSVHGYTGPERMVSVDRIIPVGVFEVVEE